MSLGFIGGSALLNYRMGYVSAGNEVDGIIYGGLAALGDGLKALAPFVAAWGWKHRDWLAVTAATAVFAVFTAYSFTSGLGFSSQHRTNRQGTTAASIERHQNDRKTVLRDQARLDALGTQRSSTEVRQSIENQFKAPVGSGRWTVDQLSNGCVVNKPATRAACATIANLKLELARAEEAERLTLELKSITQPKGHAPVLQSADPQTDALALPVPADDGQRPTAGIVHGRTDAPETGT